MFRLKELKKQQEQKQQQQQSGTAPTTTTTTNGDANATSTGTTDPTEVKRQNSNDIKEIRRQKSKDSYFSLKSKQSSDSSTTRRANPSELRAQKDIDEMEVPEGCKVNFKDTNDILNFTLDITPIDGLYQSATFRFTINIPATYPYDPPKVHCDTLVYHPNIDFEGHVCLNILRQDWMPVLNIGTVIFGLMTLFLEPNPDDPLNKEAAQLMIENKKQFETNVKSSLRGGYVVNRQFPRLLS